MHAHISTLPRPSALWQGRPVEPYYFLEHQHFPARQNFFLSSTSSTSKRGHHFESSANGEGCSAVRVLSRSSCRSLMNLLQQNILLNGGTADVEAHSVWCRGVLAASFSPYVSLSLYFLPVLPALTMHAGMCSLLSEGHPVSGLGRLCHIRRGAAMSGHSVAMGEPSHNCKSRRDFMAHSPQTISLSSVLDTARAKREGARRVKLAGTTAGHHTSQSCTRC